MIPLHKPSAVEFLQKRKASGLSQSGLAELLGLHKNTIKNFEASRSQCTPQLWYFTLARLAERDQEIKQRIEEHCRRWVSKSYRSAWRRKAQANYGD